MHCAKSKCALSTEQAGYTELSANSRVRSSSTHVLTLMLSYILTYYIFFVVLFRLRNNSFSADTIKYLITEFCGDCNHRTIR